MERTPAKIAFLLQGPVQQDLNGYSTVQLLDRLNASPLRHRFTLVSVLWDDEREEHVELVRSRVDDVVFATKPPTHGAGNRDFQSTAVSAGLAALEGRGYTHVLKSRHDFLLSEHIIADVVARADAGFDRLFTTNLFTRRETFHISDMFLFSTLENLRAWYDPRVVYYQDLYSPEVQFARCFVRNKQLGYHFTQVDYLRFLRDWVDLVDWAASGIIWFKDPTITRERANAENGVIRDRDSGAFMHKLLPGDYPRRLRRHGRELPLQTRALAHRLADALFTYCLIALERVGGRVFGEGPRYWTIPLPGARALDVKFGFSTRRYFVYAVDPYSGEAEKPIGRELTRDPKHHALGAAGALDDDLPSPRAPFRAPSEIRGPFGVAVRRRGSRTSPAPRGPSHPASDARSSAA